ncbi:MAG: glycosyltransferase [Sterolibacteriaceae bacterium]|uniref:Glycosyltransferase n=1 Tax=Candidatus Methylophosphatis roskildensis TaxID=2899263 RepID=A0A9D7DWI9_9PROT|nr:glycosyltransferase [Candidatus Methylophosphatis roskildensis]MBK7238483.1 glycosyltransferase [Sterolibacteriaceae bacterium]
MSLRVLFITTGLGTGGAERMLVKLIESLGCRGVECRTVSLLDAGSQGDNIRDLGVVVDELRMNRVSGMLLALFRIVRVMWSFKPDVVQGWMYHGNLGAMIAWLFRPRRCRLFWGIRHSPYALSQEPWLTRQLIRLGAMLSGLPQRLIYNSRVSVELHSAIGYAAKHAIVIPNGFNLLRFHADPERRNRKRGELGIAPETPVVGVVARNHPMKDHGSLVEAAVRVRQDFPAVLFLLAGSGIDSSNTRLADRIAARGLNPNFLLLGEVSDTENLYPAMDVCALSSSWGEAFPNVLGEAMASGIPCVSTDVGDARLILGDTGTTVPSRDSAALAEAISRMLGLDDAARRQLGERASERIGRLFSLDAVSDAYLGQYAVQETTRP